MTLELQDSQTFNGQIANGGTETLEVETATSQYIQVMLDDGVTGNDPPQYTLIEEYYQPEFGDYMEYSTATGQTNKTLRDDARGSRVRFRFENTSGSSASFRIIVQTFGEL